MGAGLMGGGGMMGAMGPAAKGGPKGIVLAEPKGAGFGGGGFGAGMGCGKMGGDTFKWGKGGTGMAALPNPAATGELADQAIAEIKEQMASKGEPKVWIDDWRERYRSLGPSPKQFLEARPDVFRLHYTGGKGYSVYLVEYEGAPHWKGGGVGKGPAAQQQMAEDAILGELDL